jgi:hypothetical protein
VDIGAQIARWPALAEGHGERVVRAHRPNRGHALRLSRGPSDGLREADGTLRTTTMENEKEIGCQMSPLGRKALWNDHLRLYERPRFERCEFWRLGAELALSGHVSGSRTTAIGFQISQAVSLKSGTSHASQSIHKNPESTVRCNSAHIPHSAIRITVFPIQRAEL